MEKEVKTVVLGGNKQAVRLLKDNNSVLILVVLLAVGFFLIDGFANGFYNVIIYSAEYGVICLGLALVMITGNIDLSVGFQAGLASVTTIMAFNTVSAATGNGSLALAVGVIAALVTGAITGFINGFVVTRIGVNPLIATIATNYIFKGLVFVFAQNSFQATDSDTMKLIARTNLAGQRWLTPMVIIFVAVIAVATFLMYKTKYGNSLYVVGDNPEAGAFAGISVPKTVLFSFVLCGLLSALTGFMMASFDGYAIFTQGNALSTFPISCCVIGGIKMTGGKGTAVHVLLGVLIMRTISQMMNAMFWPADRVNLITGALLIVVLIIDRFTSAKSTSE